MQNRHGLTNHKQDEIFYEWRWITWICTFRGTVYQFVLWDAEQWATTVWDHISAPVLQLCRPPTNHLKKVKHKFDSNEIPCQEHGSNTLQLQYLASTCLEFQHMLLSSMIQEYKFLFSGILTSFVQGPFTSSGLSTFCHLWRHWTSVRSEKWLATSFQLSVPISSTSSFNFSSCKNN